MAAQWEERLVNLVARLSMVLHSWIALDYFGGGSISFALGWNAETSASSYLIDCARNSILSKNSGDLKFEDFHDPE